MPKASLGMIFRLNAYLVAEAAGSTRLEQARSCGLYGSSCLGTDPCHTTFLAL